MAESQSGYDMAEHKKKLDEMMASVMPDSWDGFGRLKLAEREFSHEEEQFAETLFERITGKHPDADAEMLAEKVIEKTEEKF